MRLRWLETDRTSGVTVDDVELDRQGGAAVGLDSFCDRVGSGRVQVGYGDRRASSGEGFCGGLTNAACGAGDEGDLAGEHLVGGCGCGVGSHVRSFAVGGVDH